MLLLLSLNMVLQLGSKEVSLDLKLSRKTNSSVSNYISCSCCCCFAIFGHNFCSVVCWSVQYLGYTSSCSYMFFKIGVPKNFAKFTGKHLYWSLFLIKFQVSPTQVFSCEFWLQFFFRTPLGNCFWRCHAEFFVVIYICYPAATMVKLKEHLEIYGHCSYYQQ